MTGPTIRHFIFDYNLSNSYRSQHETQPTRSNIHPISEKSQSFERIERHVNDMSVVGLADKLPSERFSEVGTVINPIFDNSMVEPVEKSDNELELVKSFHMLLETPSTPGMIRLSNIINSSKNLLAERVLQWLDLASGRSIRGKSNSKSVLNTVKKKPAAAYETQKEVSGKPKACRDLVHQLSMTFNEGNTKDLSNRKISPNFARKVLSLRKIKNTPDELDPLILHPLLGLKSSKRLVPIKNSSPKTKQIEYFEDQYQSIIHRQMLESSCNTQLAKRQLHIFMPNLPRRCLIVNETNIPQIIPSKSVNDR